MSEQKTLVFKTEEERAKALLEIPDEPNGKVNDLDAWYEQNDARRKEIEEAKIEAQDSEPAPQEPVPETKPEPSTVEDIVAFSLKRDELPEILRPYKNADEIIKTAAHAREYANRVEKELEASKKEKERIKQELETAKTEAERMKKQLEESIKQAPTMIKTSGAQNVLDELENSIKKMEIMDESDYVTVGQSRTLFKDITSQIKGAFGELHNIKNDIKREADSLKTELGNIKSVSEKREKESAEQNQRKAFVDSLNALQEKYPELKTSKALIEGQNCVEKDIQNFGKKILGGLYNNYDPTWENVIAVTNAYIKGHPEIKQYCEKNAITPESVGSSFQDIQNYALINYIDKRASGLEILDNGTVKKVTNPFTGKEISYKNHIDAYESFKRESGIADNEIKKIISDAEKRAALNIQKAMSRRATEAPILGNMGEASPENVGQEMTKEEAIRIMKMPGIEEKAELEARKGKRDAFNLLNKAYKRLGHEPSSPDPDWPPEKK